MISVIIPTLNAQDRLGACLAALVAAAVDGLVREVIVVDGGSADASGAIADGFGARLMASPPGRGGQLAMGAGAAKSDWLLFVHADTVLGDGWACAVENHIAAGADRAGVFALRFDAPGLAARIVTAGAMARTALFKAPYGDQGLLISKRLYEEIGGYGDMPLMEDVDIIRRLIKRAGRAALCVLPARAVTSAARYERDGYARRSATNIWLLTRYFLGASPENLARDYHRNKEPD